jgi:GMP synthase-like glutamine amidotransferase
MNIGLLQCGKVQDELAAKHGQYPAMFSTLLQKINPSFTWAIYDVEQGELPNNIDDCDAYLISGSHHGVYDHLPWIAPLQEFIRQLFIAQKKTIGICFGHQLVAQALGGKVIKSPKGWGVGISTSTVIQNKPWMNPARHTFNLIISHQDQVVELPSDAEILAGNEFCTFYMTQIGSIVTIQGHPEFSTAYARSVLERRKDILTTEIYEQGLNSLTLEKDDAIIAQWMVNFISS